MRRQPLQAFVLVEIEPVGGGRAAAVAGEPGPALIAARDLSQEGGPPILSARPEDEGRLGQIVEQGLETGVELEQAVLDSRRPRDGLAVLARMQDRFRDR